MSDIVLPTSYINSEKNKESYSQHSIDFFQVSEKANLSGAFNTWRDWHLVPTSRPVVNPPKTRTEYVTVPGRDGILDFSEALDGIHYDNRTGSWEFVVANDYHKDITWAKIYSDIMNNLHGKNLNVSFLDDPEFYYTGRIYVNQWKSNEYWSTITLDYDLYPFKVTFDTVNEETSDWLFNDAITTRKKRLYYSKFHFTNSTAGRLMYRDVFLDGQGTTGIVFRFTSNIKNSYVVISKYCENKGIYRKEQEVKVNKYEKYTAKYNAQTESSMKLTPGRNHFRFAMYASSKRLSNYSVDTNIGSIWMYYNKGASL